VPTSRVVNTDALTRELLLDAVRRSPIDLQSPVDDALIVLLIARLSGHSAVPLQLPMPADTRARALADALLAEPALSIVSAVATIGASRRTLERLFAAETQMTLAAWQRRARVLASVELMAQGSSVTNAATAVGYSTPSSFVTAFRSEFGRTPREFMGPVKL
jgi:AraC-like DNA-binding protein